MLQYFFLFLGHIACIAYAAYCYRLSGVVCVLVTTVTLAKTAEQIELPIGGRLVWAQVATH